jgi:hypothetical protein
LGQFRSRAAILLILNAYLLLLVSRVGVKVPSLVAAVWGRVWGLGSRLVLEQHRLEVLVGKFCGPRFIFVVNDFWELSEDYIFIWKFFMRGFRIGLTVQFWLVLLAFAKSLECETGYH